MNYDAKRLKVVELMLIAKDRTDWYESDLIYNAIVAADKTAKVDVRHANGILDRLLGSTFCTYLLKEQDKKND